MGKAKRNKGNKGTDNPTGLLSVRQCEAISGDQQTLPSVVLNLIEKLQSPSSEEKECACSTIAHLVSQASSIHQFMEAEVVRVAGPLLIDQSLGVRQAALGALRNMTVDGGAGTCIKMVEQDIMTPLVILLQKYGTEWNSQLTEELHKEVFHQALHLLWNLCEASPTAVTIVNQQNLVSILSPCLPPEIHGYDVAITAGQCLCAVTEENEKAASILNQTPALQELQKLLVAPGDTMQLLLHKVLVAGILYNISGGNPSVLPGSAITQIIELLGVILQHNVTAQLLELTKFLDNMKNSTNVPESSNNGEITDRDMVQDDIAQSTSDITDDNHVCDSNGDPDCMETVKTENPEDTQASTSDTKPSADKRSTQLDPFEIKHRELDKLLAESQFLITAQQLAIEMTANLCCSPDDDAWEDVDGSDTSSDDMTSEGGAVLEEEPDMDLEHTNGSFCLSSEVQKAFVDGGLISQVFQKLKSLDPDVTQILQKNYLCKKLVKSYQHLQLRALLCTANLVSTVEISDLGGEPALHDLWTLLTQLTGTEASSINLTTSTKSEKEEHCYDTLEGASSALRAVVEKLTEIESPKLREVMETDLQFLYQLGTKCPHPQVRANAVRIVASLGCAVSKCDNISILQGLGEFLYSVASTDSELWVVAETLDAMFDVFADDKTDPIFKQLELVPKLREMVPALKQKVQLQKRHLGEHYAIVSTAKTNLVRFIKYKASSPTAT